MVNDVGVNPAKTIIYQVPYATLSTTTGQEPWNSAQFCAYDSGVNFYWSSLPTSEHFKNIISTKKVFIVIYDSKSEIDKGKAYLKKQNREWLTTNMT